MLQYYVQEAKQAMKAGDWAKADTLVKEGQQMDFHNEKLKELRTQIDPQLKKAAMAKRSSMSPAELTKEKGNDDFKNANFDGAIGWYTKALDQVGDKTSKLAKDIYNNRCACHQQQSNYQAMIEDASAVLELEPENLKALTRRGLAFEGMERFKLALQDIRQVLFINPGNDVANKAQHRISSALRREEKMKKDGNF